MKVMHSKSFITILRKAGGMLPLLFGLTGAVLGTAGFIASKSVPRIGVIRSDQLVYEYSGMKEAQDKYKGKREAWELEADSLDREFNAAVGKYKSEEQSLSASRRLERQQELALLQQSLTQHKSNLAEKAAKEDQELTEGVLSQINEFVENYGKEHGYDVVLGTDGTGNILHSDDYLDITDQVLDALNRSHRLADNR